MRSCLNTGNCGLLGEAKHITIRQCFARGGAVRERLFSGKMFSRFLRRTRLSISIRHNSFLRGDGCNRL